jgi:transmembrane sensor
MKERNVDSQATEAVAAAWIIKRQADDWSEADESQLNRWLAESVAHRVAYIRLDTVWRDTERLKALGAGVPRGTIPPPKQRNDARDRKATLIQTLRYRGDIRWSRWGVAAALAFAMITGVTWYSSKARATDYATGVGQLKTIVLADGSQVTLNTESHISVLMHADERQINLVAGEVYFNVTKDRSRPFVIRVADKQVTAVGTEFSVRREAEDMQVLVTVGRVSLASISAGMVRDPTFVEAGTLAQTMKSKILTRRVSDAEQEQLLSWQNGFVFFRDTGLTDAVTELNRYRKQKIVIADSSIASIRIGGRFRSTNAEAFLALLQERFPVVVEEHGTSIVLKRRP